MTTSAPYTPPPTAPKATGGLMALGIISIIYSVLFRLCCGLSAFMSGLFMMLFSTDAMRSMMDLPEMESLPAFEAMLTGPMQSYNIIKGFVLLVLGIGMLAGGIGLLRLKPWGRTLLLGVAGGEIAWAIIDFAITVFFIYPSMTQMMGEELPQMPQMIGNVVGAAFLTFMKLVFPVALLVCLNLGSIRRQLTGTMEQSQIAA